MSFQITTAFVKQFQANIEFLVQQRGSRLRDTVMSEGVTGEEAFFEQIGPTEVVDVISRHGDSPLVSTPHSRRRVSMVDSDWGDLIDKLDKVKMLINPESEYALNASWAMGRRIDDHIITAATGNASTGKDGSTTVALPAAQTIAVDFVETGGTVDSNLTIPKLRRAKRLLDAAEVDPEDRHIAIRAGNLNSLLRTTEVTSSDFNTVKSLVNGELNTFLGFKFHHTERLANVTATNVTSVLAYHRTGIKLGVGQDMITRMQERSDKRFSMYVFLSMSFGATRMQEEKVVEILCDEDL